VRYRALVLLTGFDDSRIKTAIRDSLSSPNDRVRTVAYGYLERNPDPALVPTLLGALEKELAEFVRPALIRALGALGSDPRVRPILVRESGRGEDFFRSAVIEALGDYKADYAVDSLLAIANLDGPLADDAVLALGKIGNRQAFELLARLRMRGHRPMQPFVSTAVCLLGVDCEPNEQFLAQTLTFSESNAGFPELLRGAATGLGTLAVEGRASALATLLRIGEPAREPTRSRVALAVGTVALRNTPLFLSALERHPSRAAAVELLSEGFDMLEEDLEKERFFVLVRRAYWEAPEGSLARELAQALIAKLGF
jgi:HEAT repeat protein